jgi:resuscitation-promoting factor RpfB
MKAYLQKLKNALHPGILLFLALLFVAAGCSVPAGTSVTNLPVTVVVDSRQVKLDISIGMTVQNAIEKAQISLGSLDRVEPPLYTVLTNAATIKVIRVKEVFENDDTVLAYQTQKINNESLPEGQTLLIQPGVSGLRQDTYRRVFENDVQVTRTLFKSVVIKEAVPQIVMVGVQSPFSSVAIAGRLAFINAGNAWIMEGSTGNRFPVVTSGDLDGRVFTLSGDARWLMFTRKADKADTGNINSLWAINLADKNPQPVNLKVKNIIHHAAWIPGSAMTITYSTVEARSNAPGWQANNDLYQLTFSASGSTAKQTKIIEANSGGIYGWWGTNYFWAPDGSRLAFSRPDSVGLVNIDRRELVPLVEIVPLQTRGDWAWAPNVGWSFDKNILYSIVHPARTGMINDESSPLFDLAAVPAGGGAAISLVSQSGMFAYPAPSPALSGQRSMVAYLQAIFPERSETSRYRLAIMDRDGSNRRTIFPAEGSPGMEPQQVIWSPGSLEKNNYWLALTYQGNIWLINPETRQSQQVTGDGSSSKIDWKK